MSTQADLGAAALSNRDYPTAILHYTTALRTSRSPLWLTNRSIAYTRIGNHEAALRDANEAVLVSRVRARRELILQAQMRRAISLFSLGRLGDAKAVLELIKDKVGEKVDASWGVWMMKVGKALEGCAEEERKEKEKVTVGEWPEEVEVEEEVEEVAGKGKEVEKKGEKNGGEEKEGKEKKEAAPAVPAPKQVIRHEWYQSSDSLSISILCKGVDKEKVEVTFEEEMVEVIFPVTETTRFHLKLDPLYGKIRPKLCEYHVMPSKVEIKLHKLPPGQKWPSLTRESNAEKNKEIEKQTTLSDRSTPTPSVNDAKNATQPSAPLKPTPDPIKEKAPAYPTSSRTGPKNWDAIAAESLKSSSSKDKDKGANELDGMDDEEGDPLNAFFKQLYAKSDPDTRRAMMKSYTESGGTALSTNWDEVGKARVKVSPPEGMVEKKFEA